MQVTPLRFREMQGAWNGVPQWLLTDDAKPPCMAKIAPLTKFEQTMVIAWRAIRLSQGAVPNIATDSEDFDILQVAADELKCGVAPPVRVMRYLPDESHVEVDANSATLPPHLPCHVHL
jgi:DNA-directed RNA polymerase subunit K/omega